MPNRNGRGPEGAGSMTGRGLGFCGGAEVTSPRGIHGGMGRGYGPGCGFGLRYGRGLGRGAGWFAVGYGDTAPGTDMISALEQKRSFLQSELSRTEALLGSTSAHGAAQAGKEADE